MDFLAFAIAATLTSTVALLVAWWYVLEWSVVLKYLPLYLGMFAMAVGVPAYYVLRHPDLDSAGHG